MTPGDIALIHGAALLGVFILLLVIFVKKR